MLVLTPLNWLTDGFDPLPGGLGLETRVLVPDAPGMIVPRALEIALNADTSPVESFSTMEVLECYN